MGSAIQQFDAAIVGAGPAGSATAIHLARAGYRVVLLDRDSFPRDKPCAEYLSPAAEPLLRDLGVLGAIEAQPHGRLRGFRIYAPNGRSFQGDFAGSRDATGHSYYETGLSIPRLRLDGLLVDAARDAGVEVRERWRLARFSRADGVWTLTPTDATDDAPAVQARLLIGADGLRSLIARRLGLSRPGRLRKIALVAHARGVAGLTAYGEMHVAHRRYVGIAPLESATGGDLANIAIVVDQARDGRRLAGRAEQFLLETLRDFPMLQGRLDTMVIERHTLTTSNINVVTRRISGDGLLLVGDATGYYDPFTGEGIYRALRGGRLAASVAQDALQRGDISAATLAQYDRLHRQEFRGKRAIEMIIQSAVQIPPLMDHIAAIMARNKVMADTIVAVTGDFQPSSAVLRPGYLLRLVV